ncbi:MAG TPA: hypothetical protein VMW76_08560 [Bacteroidales bacterium]|nr:hypothetical protein [Bacteroidales bacterium]
MNTSRNITRLITTAILMVSVVGFTSFGYPPQDITGREDTKAQGPDSRNSMLNILEALESGQEYEKPERWADKNYFYFDIPTFRLHGFYRDFEFGYDYDFSIPDFRIDEQFLEEFGERMEHLEKQMHERFKELEKRMESLNRKI